MKYKKLGNSGLKVSRFAFGNWGISQDESEKGQQTNNELVKLAFDNGINFFDTAETYANGKGERLMGKALKALNTSRHNYILATKLFWGYFDDENTNKVNSNSTNRKHIIEGLNRSLKNLDHDYVDVLFLHRYDEETPTLEVCQTMADVISQGKVMYWATSTWPAVRIMEAILLCDQIGAPRPIADQCIYNMLKREMIEKEYTILFDNYNLGTTTWSPLHVGVLTGKYNDGVPEDSRIGQRPDFYKSVLEEFFGDDVKEKTLKTLTGLQSIAEKLECTLPQLAIAWTLKSKDVSTVLLGASRTSQLEENLKALGVADKIDDGVEAEIEEILGNRPKLDKNYRSSKPGANRR